jgi:hypothetical protein
VEELVNSIERKLSRGKVWRLAALTLAILSILVNVEWVSLPFSFYGLAGRPGVLYGDYSLLLTFYFHPSGYFWWLVVGLQVFATFLVLFCLDLQPVFRILVFIIPAGGLLLLDAYFILRSATLDLWGLFALGLVAPLLLIATGFCYTKSH